MKIQLPTIRQAIRLVMNDQWKEDARYQIEGKFISEHKAFIFDLATSKELPAHKTKK